MSTKVKLENISPTIGNTMLADASGLSDLFPRVSIIEQVQRDFTQKASREFDHILKNYVTKNLKELGFEFYYLEIEEM